MSQDLRFVSRCWKIAAIWTSWRYRFLNRSISKTIGSYEFIFRKQTTLCTNIHENSVLDDDSDDFDRLWWDFLWLARCYRCNITSSSKIISSPKIITKVDFSLLLQKRSLDGGRPGCPEALSTTNPPGFEQYQKPCVEGGISDIQCVPGTDPSARGSGTSWKSQWNVKGTCTIIN